jgi:hypothetical protein
VVGGGLEVGQHSAADGLEVILGPDAVLVSLPAQLPHLVLDLEELIVRELLLVRQSEAAEVERASGALHFLIDHVIEQLAQDLIAKLLLDALALRRRNRRRRFGLRRGRRLHLDRLGQDESALRLLDAVARDLVAADVQHAQVPDLELDRLGLRRRHDRALEAIAVRQQDLVRGLDRAGLGRRRPSFGFRGRFYRIELRHLLDPGSRQLDFASGHVEHERLVVALRGDSSLERLSTVVLGAFGHRDRNSLTLVRRGGCPRFDFLHVGLVERHLTAISHGHQDFAAPGSIVSDLTLELEAVLQVDGVGESGAPSVQNHSCDGGVTGKIQQRTDNSHGSISWMSAGMQTQMS